MKINISFAECKADYDGEMEQQYHYNTKKLFRIWFNKDPDIFMYAENKLRIKQLRDNNPSATITLLYSATLLSEQGMSNLKYFCQSNTIDYVDINKISIYKSDEELMKLVHMELDNWIIG